MKRKIFEIVNLTPHPVKLIWENENGVYDEVILEGCSNPARVEVERETIEEVILKVQVPALESNEDIQEINARESDEAYYYTYPIKINKVKMGKVVNLPAKKEGVLYLVSRQVAEACPERDDLVIVDEAVRNEKGEIIGAKALAKIS